MYFFIKIGTHFSLGNSGNKYDGIDCLHKLNLWFFEQLNCSTYLRYRDLQVIGVDIIT